MTTFVKMAQDQKPEDFKDAVVSELNTRLQTALNDKRDEMTADVFGEELVNKHDKTEEKKAGNVPPAKDPKATNPGAEGHEQTDEKKTGKKKATPPSASMKEEMDKDDDDDKKDDKDKSKESDDDKDMDDKSKSKDKDKKDSESDDDKEDDDDE